MEINYNLIGRRIAFERKQQNLTQEQLAEKADINEKYVSCFETSRSIPSIQTVMKLCKALEVTPNYLLFGITDDIAPDSIKDISNKLSRCNETILRQISKIIDVLINEK